METEPRAPVHIFGYRPARNNMEMDLRLVCRLITFKRPVASFTYIYLYVTVCIDCTRKYYRRLINQHYHSKGQEPTLIGIHQLWRNSLQKLFLANFSMQICLIDMIICPLIPLHRTCGLVLTHGLLRTETNHHYTSHYHTARDELIRSYTALFEIGDRIIQLGNLFFCHKD